MTPSRPSPSDTDASAPIVYVVDDDVSVRESLELLLRIEGWVTVLCPSAEAFLQWPRTTRPGCIVLDVALPDLGGLDLQARLVAESEVLPIVFITGYGTVPMTVKAMKAGAAEFLTKPIDPDALLEAVAAAVARSRARMVEKTARRDARARYGTLTAREREVMTWVIEGRLNKQIAGELGISEITVKAHRGQVMRKMGVRSVPALVRSGALVDEGRPSDRGEG